MTKAMTWYGIQMKTMMDDTTSKLSELLMQGTNMGIIAAYPANVFVCGDAANGASLVVRALADGKRMAGTVHSYLNRQ